MNPYRRAVNQEVLMKFMKWQINQSHTWSEDWNKNHKSCRHSDALGMKLANLGLSKAQRELLGLGVLVPKLVNWSYLGGSVQDCPAHKPDSSTTNAELKLMARKRNYGNNKTRCKNQTRRLRPTVILRRTTWASRGCTDFPMPARPTGCLNAAPAVSR